VGSGNIERGVSGEAGLSRFSRSRIRVGRLWSGVGSRGCVIIAKFFMKSLHFLHTDVISDT